MNAIFYNQFDNSYIPHILEEIYIEKVYDRFFHGKQDMAVLDIGANIGLFSMFSRQHAKKVFAIEPAQEHFDVLQKNIEYNKWDNVTPIRKAIFTESKPMQFFHNKNTTMFSLSSLVEDKTSKPESVDAIDFETLFNTYKIDHIDFMKLDIEGAEVDVIGGSAFEKVCPKIDSFVIEYHDWSGRNPSQLATTLKDYGYNVFPIKADAKLFGGIRNG